MEIAHWQLRSHYIKKQLSIIFHSSPPAAMMRPAAKFWNPASTSRPTSNEERSADATIMAEYRILEKMMEVAF
jgi:hypothetical protein